MTTLSTEPTAVQLAAVLDGTSTTAPRTWPPRLDQPPGWLNGCPAGTDGYHAPTGACEPNRTSGSIHSPSMRWIIGAVGDNGQGMSGVNWAISIVGVSAPGKSRRTAAVRIRDRFGVVAVRVLPLWLPRIGRHRIWGRCRFGHFRQRQCPPGGRPALPWSTRQLPAPAISTDGG